MEAAELHIRCSFAPVAPITKYSGENPVIKLRLKNKLSFIQSWTVLYPPPQNKVIYKSSNWWNVHLCILSDHSCSIYLSHIFIARVRKYPRLLI